MFNLEDFYAFKNLSNWTFLFYWLFFITYNTYYFATIFKHAIIVPIAKQNYDLTMPENYHPISLLFTVSQLLMHVIYERLTFWIDSNNIIRHEHFSFTGQHNTALLHSRITEYITNNPNKNAVAIVALLYL